jgi:ubiquinone/menaquinone biosynthesis C-methylase UbiE
MADTTPEQQSGSWNHVARRYAEHIDPMTAQYAADAVELVVGSGDRVLDVASGYGAATLVAARRAGEVVAVDFSSEMCEALAERAEGEGVDNVVVREMDAQRLVVPDDGFDVSLSSFGAMMCPDRGQAFAEMARVTRPGGRLALVVWQAPPNNDWLQVMLQTLATALPDAGPPSPPTFIELADPDRLRSEVESAGWTDVEVVGSTHEATWADAGAAWSAIAESNPVFGPLLDELPFELVVTIRRTFDGLIEARGDARLSAGAWIATGTA